eukprot:CAMPEP_0173402406 /NCGR_PEP_ID=MMETSP1356-20130122/53805_1 /TAXON_ID=77927 ORGANISM="Hemiselmis virescens, Strain PCC157" /NCGR_SAMPLE_ID=MMETSP1356 /ASSEMBLY_ACC=CAM_ASM_000847 /LENGTH=100 /DNA_ID=CAMNT_0014362731 /DNA_START=114 /DNA_END=413 /DNA_ORIENTATION=-
MPIRESPCVEGAPSRIGTPSILPICGGNPSFDTPHPIWPVALLLAGTSRDLAKETFSAPPPAYCGNELLKAPRTPFRSNAPPALRSSPPEYIPQHGERTE